MRFVDLYDIKHSILTIWFVLNIYLFLVTSPPTKHLEALPGIVFSITMKHHLYTTKFFHQLDAQTGVFSQLVKTA